LERAISAATRCEEPVLVDGMDWVLSAVCSAFKVDGVNQNLVVFSLLMASLLECCKAG